MRVAAQTGRYPGSKLLIANLEMALRVSVAVACMNIVLDHLLRIIYVYVCSQVLIENVDNFEKLSKKRSCTGRQKGRAVYRVNLLCGWGKK